MSIETDWVRSLDDAFIECRQVGHNWTLGGGSHWRVGRGRHGRVLRCERCGMERLDIFDSNFWLVGRRYRIPDGYQKPAGFEPIERRELIREQFRRGDVGKTQDAPRELIEISQGLNVA